MYACSWSKDGRLQSPLALEKYCVWPTNIVIFFAKYCLFVEFSKILLVARLRMRYRSSSLEKVSYRSESRLQLWFWRSGYYYLGYIGRIYGLERQFKSNTCLGRNSWALQNFGNDYICGLEHTYQDYLFSDKRKFKRLSMASMIRHEGS